MEFQFQKSPEEKLGFNIGGGGDQPIIITKMGDKGAAVGSGLEVNDEIMACNGKSFALLPKADALKILKNVGSIVRLKIQHREDEVETGRVSKRRRTTQAVFVPQTEKATLQMQLKTVTAERDALKATLMKIIDDGKKALMIRVVQV